MDHSSVKLNEDHIPGAKLTVNMEKLGKNEAIRWLKCRNARGRKRKLPNETLATFSSKPAKEPELCANDFSKLEIDLSKTINPSTLLLAIKSWQTVITKFS